jgi:hypothetical protein
MTEEVFFRDVYLELKAWEIPDIDGVSEISEIDIRAMFYETILYKDYNKKMFDIISGGQSELKRELLRIYIVGAYTCGSIDIDKITRMNTKFNLRIEL